MKPATFDVTIPSVPITNPIASKDTRLRPYQQDGVRFLRRYKGGILYWDMGCVDGEAVINVNRAGKGFKVKIADAYARLHGLCSNHTHHWNPKIPTKCRALCDLELHQHTLLDIVHKGRKEVIKITVRSGRNLKLTPDHHVAVHRKKRGLVWIPASKLKPGMLIYTNGKFVDKDGYVRVNGMWDHPRSKVSDSEHHRLHKKHRNMEWGSTGRGGLIKFIPDKEELISIERAGVIDVYDLVMADPHNNFVANGIVVHNCGKTRAALVIPRKIRRICVVAPKVTQGVWIEECKAMYDGLEPVILTGMNYEELDPDAPIFWMNYEIVKHKWSWFNLNRLDLLILDEAQYLKSKNAQRTQAVHALCGCSKTVVGLTGTPIYNKPKDLWSLLWAVQAGEWPPFYEFARLYCDGQPSGYGGYTADGFNRRRKRELQGRLQDVVHRVRWKDVAEVPRMDRHRIPVVLNETERRKYDRLARDARKVLVGYEGSASPAKALQLLRVTKLRSAVGQYKAKHTAEFLLTIPEGEKVVVWAHHHAVADAIADKLADEGVARVHGKMSSKKQRQQLDYFKHKARFIIVSLEAGAIGIDLSIARFAVFAELSWTPSVMAQAERRTWRSTQKRSCIMYYMIAKDTIEDRILDLLEKKVKLVYEAMDDAELLQLVGDVSTRHTDVLESIVSAIARGD